MTVVQKEKTPLSLDSGAPHFPFCRMPYRHGRCFAQSGIDPRSSARVWKAFKLVPGIGLTASTVKSRVPHYFTGFASRLQCQPLESDKFSSRIISQERLAHEFVLKTGRTNEKPLSGNRGLIMMTCGREKSRPSNYGSGVVILANRISLSSVVCPNSSLKNERQMIPISSDWQIGRFACQNRHRFILSNQRVNPRCGGFFTNPGHASPGRLTADASQNFFRPPAGSERGPA